MPIRNWAARLRMISMFALAASCGGSRQSAASADTARSDELPPESELKARLADASAGQTLFHDLRSRAQDTEARAQLADALVVPLSSAYVEQYAALPPTNRVALIELLSLLRDARAEPAFRKAMEEFLAGSQRSAGDLDLKHAARAMQELKLEALSQLLLDCFVRFEAHTPSGVETFRALNESVVANARPEWSKRLIAVLERAITLPANANDKEGINRYRDELFWQVTAAETLGMLGEGDAVAPLLRVLQDSSKADVHKTARLALAKICETSEKARSQAGKHCPGS